MMANYTQSFNNGSQTHFSQGVTGEVEFSTVVADPVRLTTFNAGDIVPIYCQEILPHEYIKMDVDSIVRQSTLLTPTMGKMEIMVCAFFVPNRVVNESSKSVFGENVYGTWTASPVNFVSLYNGSTAVQVPVGSVADYYDYPTQAPLPASILSRCNDLRFRGYIEIYNNYFRDQNYQAPIPYSKLNVYEGFFQHNDSGTSFFNPSTGSVVSGNTFSQVGSDQTNAIGGPSIAQGIYGNLETSSAAGSLPTVNLNSTFDALGSPLKANKIHDYFTSVLPSPQKGPSVMIPAGVDGSGFLRVLPYNGLSSVTSPGVGVQYRSVSGSNVTTTLRANQNVNTGVLTGSAGFDTALSATIFPSNLAIPVSALSAAEINIDVSDLRMASAVQQVYECMARTGSRYREYVRAFFGLEVDDPFRDVPEFLGKYTRTLDLYQTAQTSSSVEGNTPQGNLAGYGYTASQGFLFEKTFYEHGYLHVFAIVRHRNIYSAYMARDMFRLNMLDFYQPMLANISEQPVYTYQINPFASDLNGVFGYQEAWAEYRYKPDRVSGYMRPGVSGSLALWNYADDFDDSLLSADGEWLKSNSQQVLDRTLAVTSSVSPQLKGQFCFHIVDQLPMPTYSIPGMDII